MAGYTSGMLRDRVTIYHRTAAQVGDFGLDTEGATYACLRTVWAAADWSRGTKSLREGALDAYDTVLFRFRYQGGVDRFCMLQHQDRWYAIQSLHADRQANTIQITAVEVDEPALAPE